jgi:homoserine dehydrogenase
VLSDISALTYNYRYGYKKLKSIQNKNNGLPAGGSLLDTDFQLRVYIRFSDLSEIKDLEILEVEEEFKSRKFNYLIARINYKSLFSLYNRKDNKVFVCVL